MSRPGIAAIITCYNLGRTLDETLASVLAQTRPSAELLIVDDGSTDGFTRQTLARLEQAGHAVLRTPHRGVSAGRNLGIRTTTAPYIALVDADDVLEPTYFEKAAARLDRDPTVSFVSCGMRSFGATEEVWFPPAPNLIDSLAEGVVHISSMFRRELWEAVGGFDEHLPSYEDVDFWTTVNAQGFRGDVLPEPLLRYRVRPGSNYQSGIRRDAHERLMERIYRKHSTALSAHVEALLLAKERFILDQKQHREHLAERKRGLEADLRTLTDDIGEAVRELQALGRGRVELGDLRRTTPISPVWGLDRGLPLDRYYIHQFLERHSADIRGRVLEIKDSGYTHAYGGDRVTSADVLDIDSTNEQATIIADLSRADDVANDSYDCFILTQTLGVIFDLQGALNHAFRILKPGGVLLCTMPAAGRISYEEGLDGDYWRFTEASVRRLFAGAFPIDAFEVIGHGNVLACAAFLYGLAPHELTAEELDSTDPYFPLVYTVRAVKPPVADTRTQKSLRTRAHAATGRPTVGAVLMYHRIASQTTDRHHLCVPPDEFRSHMRCLQEARYRIVPLGDLVQAIASDTSGGRFVSLTFDDGYLDALTVAAPILSEFSFPATHFVVGAMLDGTSEFWWDTLERVFLSDRALPEQLGVRLASGLLHVPTSTPEDRVLAHDRLAEAFYELDHETRVATLERLRSWCGVSAGPVGPVRPMTGEEVRRLAAMEGASIGAHSEHHLLLPRLPGAVKRAEIVQSKTRLESLLGRQVTTFSYPYGAYDDEAVQYVREAGFECAVTTEERVVDANPDPLLIPRLEVRTSGVSAFAARIEEIFLRAATEADSR